MDLSHAIRDQYERWPYPQIPLVGSVRRADTWQLNVSYLKDRCGLPPLPSRPRILIVGCGTFQPYVVALANPNAAILATDISKKSIRQARWRTLLHGIRNVKYQTLDLNRPDTYPDGPFDYIECYGVLMNLPHPEKALTALAALLTADGIIRIMVYPYFSRRRIFQIQRLATLLGLHHQDQSHPNLLRKIILSLPNDHPLRYDFEAYQDSRNRPGIVDGFLHAGDRGFTGYQLGEMISQAGLQPAFYFHRPSGQPEKMAERLGLSHQSQMLHYLDLWQELRTNFIVCLIAVGIVAGATEVSPLLHPLLTPQSGPIVHRIKMAIHRLVGITLPSRTEDEPIHFSGKELRALSRPNLKHDDPLVQKAMQYGMILGGKKTQTPPLPAHIAWPEETAFLTSTIEIGSGVPNPFYEAIFKAYTFDRYYTGCVKLSEQIEQWQPLANPLEEEGAFGLTPFGTYQRFSREILDYLKKGPQETVSGFGSVRFQGEEKGIRDVLSFLKRFPLRPQQQWNEAELRELWILLFSYPYLFLDTLRIGKGD